ncbi:MAG: PQQ-dependent sugar dehydrogenase [Gemmatimonadaceae bacterium]
MATASGSGAGTASCPGGDPSITLPPGFCATIFADSVGAPRHVVVAPNGDVFVTLASKKRGPTDLTEQGGSTNGKTGAVIALRDTTHDGRADVIQYFGNRGNTGVGLYGGYVYWDAGNAILRAPLAAGTLKPSGATETVVMDIPATGDHKARNFLIDSSGTLYLNIGSPSNSCQVKNRTLNSPGIDPCPELDTRAGIWRFDARKTGQHPTVGNRYATGLRNGMGIAIEPMTKQMYATQHGRDQLGDNWPKLFTTDQNANEPAEELVQVNQGDDFGWPYCFYSLERKQLVLAPEYGGDGTKVGRCATKKEPAVAFPAHWAPMSLVFYTGNAFPAKYRGGAFIAFHGSWNRAPLPQAGYRVSFVPFAGGKPTGSYEDFANGFAGGNLQPDRAAHRPVGLAVAPDGAMFITDDKGGRIWRVTYHAAP